MSKNELIKGVFLVGLGATSYGMLATIVKLAYQSTEHFTTAEVISAQFIYGIFGMLLINLYQKTTTKTPIVKATSKDIIPLMLAGTSLGATSIFYYLCVKYIDVSIAIVLLMQTVWIGVLVEWILDKKAPSKQKMIAVVVVLLGTILATNLLFSKVAFNWIGFMWGMLAAASFTTTMYTANKVGLGLSSAQRSLYMLLGGAVIVLFFTLYTQTDVFNLAIFGKYGILLALFGTIIPPVLMNSGFPKTGLGLGSIVSSLELPVSVSMAYFLLNEKVVFLQWMGIILIIVIMNIHFKKK